MNITTVVVTYNRKSLLQRCLAAIAAQSRPSDRILVVDNASTDGTKEELAKLGWLSRPNFTFLELGENTGGAGGFARGVQEAAETGADWIWLMDDDAMPHPQALENLVGQAQDRGNLYGSVAVNGNKLCWPMKANGAPPQDTAFFLEQLPPVLDVSFIPFLGLLVSAELVRRIGIPDAEFFLAADDVEYCLRARKAGAGIYLVRDSHIEHPLSESHSIWLPWRKFYSLKLAPWKRYYDVRNRLFVAKRHYGLALYYSTIPGSFLRLATTLVFEGERAKQLRAFVGGMTDGVLGRGGRRHGLWGL